MVITQKVPDFPETLYKYQSFEGRALENLENKVVFLSPKNLLNDPHELGFKLESYEDYCKKELILAKQREVYFKDNSYVDSIAKLLDSEQERNKYAEDLIYFSNAIEQSGVLSMTVSPLDNLMWSHYANSHTGFCLEFESDFLQKKGCALYPVEYMNKYPILSISEFRDYQYNNIAKNIQNCTLVSMHMTYNERFEYFRNELSQQILIEALLAKHDSWIKEKEWRYIKGRNGVITYDSKKLKSVIFGYSSTNEKIENVKKILSKQELSKHFKFKKVIKGISDFNFSLIEI